LLHLLELCNLGFADKTDYQNLVAVLGMQA